MFKIGKKYGNKNPKAGLIGTTPAGRKGYIPREVTILQDNGVIIGTNNIHSYNVVDDMGNESILDDEDSDDYFELDNPAAGLLEPNKNYINLNPDAGKEIEEGGHKKYIPQAITVLCDDAEFSGLSLDSYTCMDDKCRMVILRKKEEIEQLISEDEVIAFVKRCDEVNKLMWDLTGECEELLSHPLAKLLRNHYAADHSYLMAYMHDYFKENANDENALDVDLHSATLSDVSSIIAEIAGYEENNM